jgi:DNA-binding NarL/FixJ family response regulator
MSEAKRRIFVVDDHTLVREWLTTLLRQEPDFDVCGQADAAPAALAGMISTRPAIAIVDLSLKGGSGLDLIKELQTLCPDTGFAAP